jgi:hypothetical protein
LRPATLFWTDHEETLARSRDASRTRVTPVQGIISCPFGRHCHRRPAARRQIPGLQRQQIPVDPQPVTQVNTYWVGSPKTQHVVGVGCSYGHLSHSSAATVDDQCKDSGQASRDVSGVRSARISANGLMIRNASSTTEARRVSHERSPHLERRSARTECSTDAADRKVTEAVTAALGISTNVFHLGRTPHTHQRCLPATSNPHWQDVNRGSGQYSALPGNGVLQSRFRDVQPERPPVSHVGDLGPCRRPRSGLRIAPLTRSGADRSARGEALLACMIGSV